MIEMERFLPVFPVIVNTRGGFKVPSWLKSLILGVVLKPIEPFSIKFKCEYTYVTKRILNLAVIQLLLFYFVELSFNYEIVFVSAAHFCLYPDYDLSLQSGKIKSPDH